MALVFALAAAVQWNDPDPLRWMLIYGAAALVSAGEAVGYSAQVPAVAVGVAALAWAVTLAPGVIAAGAWAHLFDDAGMLGAGVEETREMVGLLLVTAWMAATVWRQRSPR